MTDKQKKKLIKLNMKAESCLSRRKAQKVLKKADKLHQKVFAANFWAPVNVCDTPKPPDGALNPLIYIESSINFSNECRNTYASWVIVFIFFYSRDQGHS